MLDQRLAAFARTPVNDAANPMVPSVAEHTMRWKFAVDHWRSCWLTQRRPPLRLDVAQTEALRPEAGVLAVMPNVRLVIPNRIDMDHTAPSLSMLSLMS